jgi:hypothetical protein
MPDIGFPQSTGSLGWLSHGVVSFEGVSKDRIDEIKRDMSEGQQPEEVPAKEVVVLHDPEAEKSLVILFFETEDDYRPATRR